MPPPIQRDQPARLTHRLHFWGHPAGVSGARWDYRDQPWRFTRPDDGQPPARRQVRCALCATTLTYTVHSVAATHRRRAHLRVSGYVGLAAFLAGALGMFTLGDAGPAQITATLAAFFGGAALGWVCALAASDEIGVSGHANRWPGATRHHVTVELPPPDLPPLACPRCGHREEFPFGRAYRKGYVQRRYQAAKSRLDQHTCRRPG